ncbi:unnamed protein product, partial [marine sediment metagenome]
MFFLLKAKGLEWHDRDEQAGYDYSVNDFTRDTAWHDLDISGIVGVGKRLVLCKLRMKNPRSYQACIFMAGGMTMEGTTAKRVTLV